jgi:hypothetical protein
MSKTGEYVRTLNMAISGLFQEQGRIARRNARHRVLNAMAALRKALDEEYPMIKLPPKQRKVRTLAQRRRELINDGWVVVRTDMGGDELLSFVAEQKLPIRVTPAGDLDRKITQYGVLKPVKVAKETWVPGWVAHYYHTGNRTMINQARHTPQMIQAAKAAVRLGSLSALIDNKVVVIPKE